MLLAFEGAPTFQPTGTLQAVGFGPTTVNPNVNPPVSTGQANTPCAGAVGQTCTVSGGVTGPWTKTSSGHFAFTATGPAGTLPFSFPTVFIPTTTGVENVPCSPVPVTAPFTVHCIGNTVGDLLQGATITVRFLLTAGGTADVTGTATGPGVAAAAPIVPAPTAAAQQPIVIGPLLPPVPPVPPLPPLPLLPPPPPSGMGQVGGMSAPPAAPTRATPTPEPGSRQPASGDAAGAASGGASGALPIGAPPARPAASEVAVPAPPAAAGTTATPAGAAPLIPDPSALMPTTAPTPGDAAADSGAVATGEGDALDEVAPLSQQP
ncbi:MAG TPA: hypothetical protein VFE37_09655 [Chloroflexota bacterium]|nr:hypothetical protein [Chloroflexota bacterium]